VLLLVSELMGGHNKLMGGRISCLKCVMIFLHLTEKASHENNNFFELNSQVKKHGKKTQEPKLANTGD
jgi:hypothetical protein